MKNLALTFFIAFICTHSFGQAPAIQWQKSFGGSLGDIAYQIRHTSDNGYFIVGESTSNDGNVAGNHGSSDYWVVKLNDTGGIQWQKSLGGSGIESARSVQQTSDNGYIISGWSSSNDGDVSGNHGGNDFWVVKLDDSGIIQWQKSLGGSSHEQAFSIQQTTDGGYILAGSSYSNDYEVTGHHGSANTDVWVVKLNDTGAIRWQKSYGGSGNDAAYSIQQTLDGGYIVASQSSSADGDITGHHGSLIFSDAWVVKLNDTGAIQWQKSLGGSNNDGALSVVQTTDSGYIIGGTSQSNDGDVTGNHGSGDCWIVKLSSSSIIQWQKSLGGSADDETASINQTADGGFIIAGLTFSNDGDVSGNHGGQDYWVVKLNDTGAILWQKCLGGSSGERATSIRQTSGEEYVVAGVSSSTDGDVTGNHGGGDYWVVKLNCGLSAGVITGNNFLFCTDTATLYDTVSGGIWSMSNGVATISPGGLITGFSFGHDTAIYTVTNTCGSVSVMYPITIYCEGAVHPVNNIVNILITPNPTTGIISITGISNANIRIYNTLGQLLKEAKNNSISIAGFPAGLYFVSVFDEEGLLVKQEKVIKE